MESVQRTQDGREDQDEARTVEPVDMGRKAHEERLERVQRGEGTDEDRRLVKLYDRQQRVDEAQEKSDAERERIEERDGLAPGALGRDAEKNKEDEPSPGNSSEPSSAATRKSGASTKPGRRSTAPTTEPFSTPTPTGDHTARSTDGSGTANR